MSTKGEFPHHRAARKDEETPRTAPRLMIEGNSDSKKINSWPFVPSMIFHVVVLFSVLCGTRSNPGLGPGDIILARRGSPEPTGERRRATGGTVTSGQAARTPSHAGARVGAAGGAWRPGLRLPVAALAPSSAASGRPGRSRPQGPDRSPARSGVARSEQTHQHPSARHERKRERERARANGTQPDGHRQPPEAPAGRPTGSAGV